MKLDAAQCEAIRAKLVGLWRSKACSFCGGDRLTIATDLSELRPFHEGVLVDGGKVIPVVTALCSTCGATTLFNAIILGLVDPSTGKFVRNP